MRLTPQAVRDAPNVINPEGKLTVVLRDLDIPFIESLDHTCDGVQVIDLTNNHIGELCDIPARTELQTLLLARNNISRVVESGGGESGGGSVQTLVLAHNNLRTFGDVVPLRHWGSLRTLLMVGNPLSSEHHYRPFLVWLLPTLEVLDCEKVRPCERAAARDLFGASFEDATPAAAALMYGKHTQTDSPAATGEAGETKGERLMSTTAKALGPEARAELVRQLERAETMDEIERIQRALEHGYVPSDT